MGASSISPVLAERFVRFRAATDAHKDKSLSSASAFKTRPIALFPRVDAVQRRGPFLRSAVIGERLVPQIGVVG